MILVIVQIFLPILSAFGIDAIIESRKAADESFAKRALMWSGGLAAALLLILLMNGSLQDFYNGIIQGSGKRISQQIYPVLFQNMTADLYVMILISIVTCITIYFYVKGRMHTTIMSAVLLIILLFDMWRVDAKPMEYSDQAQLTNEFAKPDFVSYIQQDSSLYRVIQLQNLYPQYSNTLSYFSLQNAYGYTGAKLRNYQNMMDVAGITNPNVLRLLGVKYIISDKPDSLFGQIVFHGSQFVIRNNSVLPRAFFVKDYRVASDLTILQSLRDGAFDPAKTVYFDTDPNLRIETPDNEATANVTGYKVQSMTIQVHASGNNFLLLSEVYYPKGWEATIDGKPTTIYQSDYFLRGIMVPKGDHLVKLDFHPDTYYFGRSASLWTNIFLIAGLVGLVGVPILKRKRVKPLEGERSEFRAISQGTTPA